MTYCNRQICLSHLRITISEWTYQAGKAKSSPIKCSISLWSSQRKTTNKMMVVRTLSKALNLASFYSKPSRHWCKDIYHRRLSNTVPAVSFVSHAVTSRVKGSQWPQDDLMSYEEHISSMLPIRPVFLLTMQKQQPWCVIWWWCRYDPEIDQQGVRKMVEYGDE